MDDTTKRDLRRKAAENDRSMEEEARLALRNWVKTEPQPEEGLATRIRRYVEKFGGVELEIPPRGPARPLPDIFDDK
ncbi:plasmid stabilization protein [uncultured Devosia sp.]|uniref:FitA-like ribbon-helix-helix domain-containing protein n=1 Tax=uncultured Devosia sp. TaxID=211434 RepID=UPI0035CA491A